MSDTYFCAAPPGVGAASTDEPAPIQILGDPELRRVLARGLERAGLPVGRGGERLPALTVWWRRGALSADVVAACRGAVDAGRSFLSIATSWGSARIGPYVRGGVGDPCCACSESDTLHPDVLSPGAWEGAAELVPVPHLVAAVAAREITNAFATGSCALVAAAYHLTPYSDRGAAAPPLWFRSECALARECPGCGGRAAPPARREPGR